MLQKSTRKGKGGGRERELGAVKACSHGNNRDENSYTARAFILVIAASFLKPKHLHLGFFECERECNLGQAISLFLLPKCLYIYIYIYTHTQKTFIFTPTIHIESLLSYNGSSCAKPSLLSLLGP